MFAARSFRDRFYQQKVQFLLKKFADDPGYSCFNFPIIAKDILTITQLSLKNNQTCSGGIIMRQTDYTNKHMASNLFICKKYSHAMVFTYKIPNLNNQFNPNNR